MDESRPQIGEGGQDRTGQDRTERYTGPSSAQIANLLPHRVSYGKGWFWTTTAICHGGRSDGLAFRRVLVRRMLRRFRR